MPTKTQLSEQDISEIVASVTQVNALRMLSKKFKIGQGRIRRIWAQAGVSSQEAIVHQLTSDRMKEMMDITGRLESEVKPWPATFDEVKGLPPLTDEKQVERYLTSLRIANEASLLPGATRPMADTYYNAIMRNALKLLPKTLYQRFADTIIRERIHR